MLKIIVSFSLSLLWLLPGERAQAFSRDGHRIVGEIASHFLDSSAKKGVRELLKGERSRTLAEASTWADKVKNTPAYEHTKALHYVNIPKRASRYKASRDCRKNLCVVEAIKSYYQILKSSESSPKKKGEALKFLVHLVGDIHQPLHAGLKKNRGGTRIQVSFFGEESDLHHVWDGEMIKKTSLSWKRYARILISRIGKKEAEQWQGYDPIRWAEDSHKLAIERAYAIPEDGILGASYYRRNLPLLEEQMQKAGVRLAYLLREVFDRPL